VGVYQLVAVKWVDADVGIRTCDCRVRSDGCIARTRSDATHTISGLAPHFHFAAARHVSSHRPQKKIRESYVRQSLCHAVYAKMNALC
jgi:ligand-binding sensor domain-containing protein